MKPAALDPETSSGQALWERKKNKVSKGIYLYCIACGDTAGWCGLGVKGIEEVEARTIAYNDLLVVVHDYDEITWRAGGENADTISKKMLEHHKVVAAAMDSFDAVVPINFGTVIPKTEVSGSQCALFEWFEKHYPLIKSKLERVRGKAEYGVQVFINVEEITKALIDRDIEIKMLDKTIRASSPGTAFIYNEKLKKKMSVELESVLDGYFKDFYERIKDAVSEVKAGNLKKGDDEHKKMFMNLSCLAEKKMTERLGKTLEDIEKEHGITVRFTGPWPPYSFV